MADWMEERFEGFWPTYFVAATTVSYLFFFGIGGYLHVSAECIWSGEFICINHISAGVLCMAEGRATQVEVPA